MDATLQEVGHMHMLCAFLVFLLLIKSPGFIYGVTNGIILSNLNYSHPCKDLSNQDFKTTIFPPT